MTLDSSAMDAVDSGESVHVLYVDDTRRRSETTAVLEDEYEWLSVTAVSTVDDALDALDERGFDAVVTEYAVGDTDGLAAHTAVRDRVPDVPVVLYTGRGSEQVASEAISAGVTDYLPRDGTEDCQRLLARTVTDAVEEARAESVQLSLVEAAENAQEGVGILDEDGRFTYVNDRYTSLYGYDAESLLGSRWERLSPDGSLSIVDDEAPPAIEADGVWNGESPGLRADGSTFVGHHTVVETTRGYVCLVQDRTEAKQRERELQLKSDAIDAAPTGIVVADGTDPDTPLVYLNDRFTELTGYDKTAAVGQNCRFLQGEATREEPVAAMREAIANEASVTTELRNYRADGTMFWNEVRIRPIETDGVVTQYVGFQRDITERREREQKLTAQNERLEELASVLGHDLRNPAQVADLHLTTLRERHPESTDELDAIQRSVDRIHELTEKLVAVARPDVDGMQIEHVSIPDCASRAWSYTRTLSGELVFEGESVSVDADADRLGELFENLFHNSIVHGRDDATVWVGSLPDGFFIEDDGPGIPLEQREDVFEMGYSERPHGNGLGLGIVADVADSHDWTVSVVEGRDGGARFEITGVDSRSD